jgi:putative endonuclease
MRALADNLRKIWQRVCGRGVLKSADDPAGLGFAGERAAEAHLRANGLRVLARNWRNPADEREEIDLVCEERPGRGVGGRQETVLVFIEVKARVAGARVGGYQSVDRRKKAVLLRACGAYLARLRPPPRHVRFDIVEVVHGADAARDAAMEAMRLDPRVASRRGGRQVWHYRDVPLFPERSAHRHGRHS